MIEPNEKDDALATIRAIYEDGVATINARDYMFLKMTHEKRRKVFAFYSSVGRQMADQSFGFLDWPEFAAVERVICDNVTYDGHLLSKRRDHFDEFPEDYLVLITTAMGVMSYPFLRGSVSGLPSPLGGTTKTSLSKAT